MKRGESLSVIARRYHVSLAELREANELTARSRLRVSQTLMIPQRPAQGLPTAVARTASAAPASAAGRRSTPAVTTYRVRQGDTLYGIARRFETTVASIKQLNRLVSNRINIGDRLTVR